jgi:outer membrane protein TolC
MKGVSIFILLIFFSLLAQGQDQLHLSDAVNIALKNSLDIQLAKNKISTDSINNNYGVAGGMPLVTGNLADNEQVSNINQKLNTGSSISRSGAATNTLNVGVTGSILLYNGGKVVATKKRLGELELQSKQQLNTQVQNIMAEVMLGYYDIVRQQSYTKTIDKSIEAAKKKLEIVQASQKLGLANNADLFQAQIDLNTLYEAMQSQALVIEQAKSELLRLLTLRADSSINIADTIIVDRNISLDAVLAGIEKNPDIIAADQQVKINTLLVKETSALRYPSVRANSGYNFSRNKAAAGQLLLNQNYGPSVGVTVGIPIYNGSIYKRQIKTAQINVQNAELQKKILFRDYNAQAVKLFQSYTDAIKRIETEQGIYKLSAQLLDLSLKRFQLRQATILEVKNAEQNYEASGYRLINLNFAAKSAEIGLKKVANQLSL